VDETSVSTGAVGLISAGSGEDGGVQTDHAAGGRGPPVTWFDLVFEVVELGDRHGRVVLNDAIHAETRSARSMSSVTS
jgi:hypothetical protein